MKCFGNIILLNSLEVQF
uniref:Uncharacterized protein n=1 Tax=Anguilla anguilla TaxID=7936 RepID=A0A0E9UEK4_ANGAN